MSDAPRLTQKFGRETTTILTQGATALCASNTQNIVNALEKVNALPHDNVVASSSSSGSGGGSAEISGALQSEIQKAVSSYKKGISESTLDTEKMIKLLEALKAHRKPADKVAAAQA